MRNNIFLGILLVIWGCAALGTAYAAWLFMDAIAVHEQRISQLEENQELVAEYVLMLQARIEVLEAKQVKVDCQTDLLVSASRSSWGDAYRLMREGVLCGSEYGLEAEKADQ